MTTYRTDYSPEAMQALRHKIRGDVPPPLTTEPPEVRTARENFAFREYLRHGGDIRPAFQAVFSEMRALSEGTNSAGGYLVSPGFARRITAAVKRTSCMVKAATVIPTDNGSPMQWPTADDTGNVGAILSENATVSGQDTTFGTKALGAYMYTSKEILVSFQLMQDTGIDLEAFVGRSLGLRIGRALNAHLTNGTGGGVQPVGIMGTVTTGVTEPTGNTTTYAYDSLVDLVSSIDPEYLDPTDDSDPLDGHVGWMTTVSGLKQLRKVKDTAGAPLLAEGRPPSVLGYPVLINPDMAVPAASARSLLFGAFGRAYVVRQAQQDMNVIRLVQRYADSLQTGFIGFARYDGIPDDPAAVKALAHSAT